MKILDVREDQRMFADQIDDAWNAKAGAMDQGDSIPREDGLLVNREARVGARGTGDEQALIDVGRGLLLGQRMGAAPQGDPLTELTKLRLTQLTFELRLPGKDDLQQLFR